MLVDNFYSSEWPKDFKKGRKTFEDVPDSEVKICIFKEISNFSEGKRQFKLRRRIATQV